MAYLTTQAQLLATAAADASEISSAISAARATAAGPTTGVVAAAEDEVSAITARMFGAYGQEYQALLQRAAAFHDQFVATLAAAGNAYAQAEAAGTLGLTGGGAASPVFAAGTQAADPPVDAILIMTGSGTATPSTTFINIVVSRSLTGFTLPPGVNPIAVTTAEGFYPFTGVKDLTLDISLARGVTALDNAINLAISPGTNQSIAVFGVSQSAIIASLEMPKLLAEGFQPGQINFTLVGNESNPNGGVLVASHSAPRLRAMISRPPFGRSNTTASPTSRSIRSISSPTSTPSRASHLCTAPTRLSRPHSLLRPSR